MTEQEFKLTVANSPRLLMETVEKYGKNVIAYTQSREVWITKVYEYEKAFAEEIEKLKEGKEAVTIIKEIAKKNSLEKYREMLMAETDKKKVSYLMRAGEEKINAYKALMKIDIGRMNNV